MISANPYSKIQESNILSASGEELTLMLYEGAIKFCNLAIVAIEKKETHNILHHPKLMVIKTFHM
jgi:flagellar protein FliS